MYSGAKGSVQQPKIVTTFIWCTHDNSVKGGVVGYYTTYNWLHVEQARLDQ